MSSSLLLEAALRSVLLALAVWAGLRIFGVRNVLAQKAAWGLVLVSALGMPILLPYAAHWSVLPANVRVVIPDDPQTLLEELQARIKTAPQPKPLSEAVPAAQAASPTEGTSVDLAIDTADNGRAVQDTAIQDSAIQVENNARVSSSTSFDASASVPQGDSATLSADSSSQVGTASGTCCELMTGQSSRCFSKN